jgi:hypothetical protein
MKQRQNPNLEILQFSALHVPNLVSTSLSSGRKIQRGNVVDSPFSIIVLIFSRWLYTRSIVIDGNFSAEHLKMRQPEEDVALLPGGRYMVEPRRYELHLNTGVEIKQVSALNNYTPTTLSL